MGHTEFGDREELVRNAIRRSPLAIILTDPRLDDNPITYVNKAFESLTLYSREFAIGRNCRFLQGPQTDPADVEKIREGLKTGSEFQITLLNHRADGVAFRNQLLIAPIRSEDGTLTAYIGFQRKLDNGGTVPSEAETKAFSLLQELQHRVKNHLAMIVSMIRVQAQREVTPDSLRAISRRVEALSILYEELLGDDGNGTREISAGAYLSRIASVVASIQPGGSIRTNVECEDVRLPVDTAARLGLLLSEFLTNAYGHAFEGRNAGLVEVRFYRLSDGSVRLSVQDDGNGMPAGSNWPFGASSLEAQIDAAETKAGRLDTTGHELKAGVGGTIVAALAESLSAKVSVTCPKRGTIITVDI